MSGSKNMYLDYQVERSMEKRSGIDLEWDRVKLGLERVKELALEQIIKEQNNSVDLLVNAKRALQQFEQLEEKFKK